MAFLRESVFNTFFIWASVIFCATDSALNMNVWIVVLSGWPVKAVIGGMFLGDGDGALFISLWNSGTNWGHSFWFSRNSDSKSQETRRISLPHRYTSLLLHGRYGSEKWCGMQSPFSRSRKVSFWSCVGPSEINFDGVPKAAQQSSSAWAAVSAVFDSSGYKKLCPLWSSHSMRMYYSPVDPIPISI